MRSGNLRSNCKIGICAGCKDPTEDRSGYYCNYCIDRYKIRDKHRKEKARIIVFSHYSNSTPPKCVCCGETNIFFLTLDHINGGGIKDRKLRGAGTVMYQSLLREGLPVGLQVLCMNCNHGRMRNLGQCPHKGIIKILPPIPPRKHGLPDFVKKKKDHYISKGRNNKFVLRIEDKNFGIFYGGVYNTKKEAEEAYRKNWNVQKQ